MHSISKGPRYLLLTIALVLLSAPAINAETLSFIGNFTTDDEVRLFNFRVDRFSLVTLRTWSYAGGVNALGETISPGGFDPMVALFDGGGVLIDQIDDGIFNSVPFDPETGLALDAFLEIELERGRYTVALIQSGNDAVGPICRTASSEPDKETTPVGRSLMSGATSGMGIGRWM